MESVIEFWQSLTYQQKVGGVAILAIDAVFAAVCWRWIVEWFKGIIGATDD